MGSRSSRVGKGATLGLSLGLLQGKDRVQRILLQLGTGNSRGATTKEFFMTGFRLGEGPGHDNKGKKRVYEKIQLH
jgi:hypothetical protein